MKNMTITLLVTALSCGLAAAQPENAKVPVKSGDMAPMVTVKKFRGDKDVVFLKYYCGPDKKDPSVKAVLLDFFSADCPTCGARLSPLQALAKQYASKGLQTFLISVDPRPEEAVPAFLRAKKVGLPVFTDTSRAALSAYGFSGAPQTVLIDKDCKIVYVAKKGSVDYSAVTNHLTAMLNLNKTPAAEKKEPVKAAKPLRR